MSKIRNINVFLKELASLRDSDLLPEELYSDIEEKVNIKKRSLEEKNAALINRVLFVSLGIITAVSIVGGLTLITISYNWADLSEVAKDAFAFLILIVPQILSFFLLLKRRLNVVLNEVFSLVQAILFGVSMAFICQIYQLAWSDMYFLLTWSISTLVLIYLFNSISALFLYFVTIIVLSALMQYEGTVGLIFYPLSMALVPFYIRNIRNRSIISIKICAYLFAVSAVIAIGITMEKAVPGLWLIAYSSLFLLYYLYGALYENEDDIGKDKSIILKIGMAPFKSIGFIGIIIFSYLMLFEDVWEDVGWLFFRDGDEYDQKAAVFDYLIVIALPVFVSVLSIIAFRAKRKLNYLLILILPLTVSMYASAAVLTISDELLYLFRSCILIFILSALFKELRSALLMKQRFPKFAVYFLSLLFIATFFISNAFLVGYVATVYIALLNVAIMNVHVAKLLFRYENAHSLVEGLISGMSLFTITGVLYFLTFSSPWEPILDYSIAHDSKLIIAELLLLTAFSLFNVIFSKPSDHRSERGNPMFVSSALIVTLISFVPPFLSESIITLNIFRLLILSYIAILGIHSFNLGLKTKNVKIVILSSLFLLINIITQFVSSNIQEGILIRGFTLLALGITFFIVNAVIIMRIRRGRML